jgi:hypothetical protein
MSKARKARNRAVNVAAWSLTIAWVLMLAVLVWPHNEVTFPQGNTATVTPAKVKELGTITITFPAYCNDGQVVTVERWADIYGPGDHRLASERLGQLTFYPKAGGKVCRAPDVQEFGLTTAFQAYGEQPTVYRIRTVTSYQPIRIPLLKQVRTVEVEATTEPFTVIPR